MPRDSGGNFTPPGGTAAVAAATISSSAFNSLTTDIGTELTNSVDRGGRSPMTADIPFGGHKVTGVANGALRTDAPAIGQVQDGTLNWVVAGGAADAITAAYVPALTALVDGQLCLFRAAAANATGTPTFSPNSLTAHTITKKGGAALAISDIPGNLAEVVVRYNLASTRWELLNPAVPTFNNNQFPLNTVMLNGTIVQSQAGNAQTFAVKTLAGADPSAGDPVTFLFRDAAVATGDYLVRSVVAPLAIVIPAGQAIGFANATPGRVWIGALDNAGTVELFVVNALAGTSVYPLQGWGIVTTSAVSGAASGGVPYSQTARSSKAYVPIGYATWEAGGTLGTAGTWNVAPTRLQIFQPGSTPLPGTEIQTQQTLTGAVATGTTIVPYDDTIPQNTEGDQYMSQAATATSSANLFRVEAQANIAVNASTNMTMALFQDATASALTAITTVNPGPNNSNISRIDYTLLAATLSATTFKMRAGPATSLTMTFNGTAAGRIYGGVMNSFMRVKEIMA